ncbi:MAG: DNA repair protein RecO [Liquorilactobacillus nagelii]|jgi:DNA repair protein RecO (recombination protein O)|uniref:DNA repair protein RecO n=1 Tax=Liquorilactobacillus nagelii TaxID=82688 RepID=UPI00242E1D3E|nr:DNA repair protein RecO [Liquorilactobacillus nagelii]MCI1632459.1 DNA repair protein RecO [Liquorilactobacillus nagelii]MCI1700187.1 DNA repair protein RecO [Liquorilactobacillus nagelii]MCI1920575.1 DNA repair protein RecO [Liquorilactobacillus nagelii]MCI1976920.1 DNA repair protein RecO [Liquorilactobacillus nagelii]
MSQAQPAEFAGIVFFRRNYRERDLLVKILTDRFGFKMFFIRGARKRGFRLNAAILPFVQAEYVGSVSEDGLSFINAAKEVTQYRQILNNIELNAYVSYIFELANAAFGEAKPLGGWFKQLQQAVLLIDQGIDPAIITNIIEIRLLTYFGVQPNLHDCVICHRTDEIFDFSESYGGLICRRHWSVDPHRLQLDRRTVYFLQFFSQVDLFKIHSIKVSQTTKNHLRRTLNRIYDNQVGLKLKSRRFLEEMKIWPI